MDVVSSSVTVDLTAVIVSVRGRSPCVLEIDPHSGGRSHLPWGPFGPEHRTLEAGLREWVERQTRISLGYVEQLYTFGDSNRAGFSSSVAEDSGAGGTIAGGTTAGGTTAGGTIAGGTTAGGTTAGGTIAGGTIAGGTTAGGTTSAPGRSAGNDSRPRAARNISVAYLALVHADRARASVPGAVWRSWYDHLPWEDWREGEPESMRSVLDRLECWASAGEDEQVRARRRTRVRLAFGGNGVPRDEERVLERYELLYEAALIPEAWYDAGAQPPAEAASMPGRPMSTDHRRILATAIGRLRGKIKYRPVLFELMPPSFTLLALQLTAEALSGAGLHKQNFRRLVHNQQLVEPTGEVEQETGGRPAKLMRFRREVELERPSPGVRMSATRRAGLV